MARPRDDAGRSLEAASDVPGRLVVSPTRESMFFSFRETTTLGIEMKRRARERKKEKKVISFFSSKLPLTALRKRRDFSNEIRFGQQILKIKKVGSWLTCFLWIVEEHGRKGGRSGGLQAVALGNLPLGRRGLFPFCLPSFVFLFC